MLLILLAAITLAAVGALSAATAADVRGRARTSAKPDTCTPQTYNWTFNSTNNYAAPSPGERYEKTADGCASVWYVGSSGTVTLNVHIAECPGGSGPCETSPVTCKPGVVCQLWNPATNFDKFYVREPERKVVASGTIRF